MRKTPKMLTSQQHATWSAVFLLAAVIVTAIVFGQGDAQKAVAMIFMFFFGALCASYGAKSREKKVLESGVAESEFSKQKRKAVTAEDVNQFVNEIREKQRKRTDQ